MADNRYNVPNSNQPHVDNDNMWRAPSDTDIYEMESLEGEPYVPQAQGNPYVQNPTDVPTMSDPSREPVPSPPQQAPYIPGQTAVYTPAQDNPYAQQALAAQATPQRGALKRPRTASKQSKQQAYNQGYNEGYANAQAASAANAGSAQQSAFSKRPSAQRAPREHKRAKHWFLSFFLWLIMAGVCALLAIRMLPLGYSTSTMVPELASLVPLALIPSIFCLMLALLWHRRLLVLVCLAALGLNCYWHANYFLGSAKVSAQAKTAVITSADTSDNYARIMTVNTLNGQASAVDIVNVCREQNVEVLCLQEVANSMIDDLKNAGIDEVLPYSLVSEEATSISNGGRNVIYTKAEMTNTDPNLLPIETSSMPAVDVQIGSQTVRFVSVHPNSPVRGAQDLWDEGLSIIGSLSAYNHSYVIMGDFNSTWDHARFRELLGSTFVDASEQSGEGFHMTYPSNMIIPFNGVAVPFPSLIEIDHIIYSKNSGITVSSLETVNISGTDHMALLATLEAN